MIPSLYTASTGMDAQQLNMDNISNNLANVNTTGFKKVRMKLSGPALPDGYGRRHIQYSRH